ncbi:MAG: hypothetical protein U9N84_11595 [Actinomycetota bacterium]|nr:hypothetical protein [Actinomycetota bacterium]
MQIRLDETELAFQHPARAHRLVTKVAKSHSHALVDETIAVG